MNKYKRSTRKKQVTTVKNGGGRKNKRYRERTEKEDRNKRMRTERKAKDNILERNWNDARKEYC